MFWSPLIGCDSRGGSRRSAEGSGGGLAAGEDVLALIAGIGEGCDFAENAGDLTGDGLHIAGVHGAVVGAGGERDGLRELGNNAAERRIGNLKLPSHLVRALGEGVVLLNLVEEQDIFSGGDRILAEGVEARTAG